MEADLRHRDVAKPGGLNGVPAGDETSNTEAKVIPAAATSKPRSARASTEVKHGRAMQIVRGASLFLYFFLSCIA